MPTYLATGATYVVSATVLSPAGGGLTGAASTLLIWIRRTSDGKFLDFADGAFKSSGWTARQQAMTEVDSTNAPGLYTYSFNTGAIVSPSANDTYQIELDQVGATTAANVPQYEELLMGRHLDTIATNLNATVSSRAVPGDLMGLVAGAITSAKFAADAIDSNALAATASVEIATSVWATALPGAFASGSAGFILGTNLNVTVSSRAAPGDAMTLTSGERSAVGTAVWATATRTLTAGAITASTFSADAIDSNALAASAASEVASSVWASGTRAITGTTAGAITSASFAANALGAVWDELAASHVVAGSFGLRIGTDLDATVSSRSAPGDAMALTPGERSAVGTAVWSTGTRALTAGAITASTFSADAIDGGALAASASVEVADAVWNALAASHTLAGSFGLLVGSTLDAAVSSRATNTGAASAVWSTALPGAFAAGSAGFHLDAAVSSRLASAAYTAPLTATQTENALWDGLTAAHSTAGSFGLLVKTDLDAAVSTRATPANVSAAEAAIRGAQSLDLSVVGGAGFDTNQNSLVAVTNTLNAVAATVGDIQNTTTFSAIVPDLAVPLSGSTAYSIRVFIADSLGTPVDPDGNVVNVTVDNSSNVDRSANLSSPTMTRSSTGSYEVFYNVASNAAIEQLIFEFTYSIAATPFVRDRSSNVVDGAATFTSSDRNTLNAVLSDTGDMKGAGFSSSTDSLHAVRVRGDAAWTTAAGFAAPGDAMTLTAGERTAVQALVLSDASPFPGARIDAALSSVPGAVWATPEGSGTMGAALALLRRRTTNRRRVDASGVVTFYDDAGLPERTSTLTDVNGGPVVVVPGDPADSTKET